MKEIFTDIYKKLAGFFQAPAEEKENAKDVACNRLKFVLMQDRTNLNPYLLERMRSEIVDVLSKYVEMDREALELSFEQEGESTALMLSIPVIKAKDEEEIQAIIKAEEEAKAKAEAEASEEVESEETESDIENEEVCECGETCECNCEAEEECNCDESCECGCQEGETCDCDSEELTEEKTISKKAKKNKN